jgi:hypothetical protein
MANDPVCTIPDCGKPVMGRGWCNSHYLRWRRHGDPLSGRVANGELMAEVRRALSDATPDKCWEWPYGKASTGYGHVNYNGKNMGAHRVVCILASGESGDQLHAAHKCGNRGCINPHHLRFATATENQSDCVAHGTRQRGQQIWSAKLTPEDVHCIRKIWGERGLTMHEIGSRFNVSHSTISEILSGKRWEWLNEN